MGAKNSCFRKKQTKNEQQHVDISHKDCIGTNTGTLRVEGDINNYFQPTSEVKEKQDDITDAKLDMKEMLKSKYINIQMPHMPWFKKLFLTIEKYYVQLEMDEGDSIEACSVGPLELSDIFEPVAGSHPYRILIEGNPGYGKSTLSMKIAFDWARNTDYLRRFDLVFLLQLRSLTSPLEESIVQLGKVGDMAMSTVRKVIAENSEKVLLILDGFDELSENKIHWLLPIMECTVYPRMTVVMTSRKGYFSLTKDPTNPFSQYDFMNVYWRKQITIKGITRSQQSYFLKKCFPECGDSEWQDNYNRITNLIPDLREDIVECPLFLLLIVLLAENREIPAPKTKTDLYKAIFNFVIKRTSYKDGATHDGDIFSAKSMNAAFQLELLKKFGKLALCSIQIRKLIFTEEEILSACGGDTRILQLGFIVKNVAVHGLYTHEYYEVIHKSFVEFLAAVYLWLLHSSGFKDEFASELRTVHKNCFSEETGQLILPFLCGLLKENACAVFHALAPYAFMYSDIRPFESTLVECEPSEELLSALLRFIPTRWTIPSFYEEWFSVSLIHSKILDYGNQVGKIKTLEWDLAHAASLPLNFEIQCVVLVIEDLSSQLNELDCIQILCNDLTLDFRYAPADNILNNWSSLMSLLSKHFKATNVCFNMGFSTDTLLPLLLGDVTTGIHETIPVTALTCAVEENMEAELLLEAIAQLIKTGKLQNLNLTISFWDMTNKTHVINQVVHQASQSSELLRLELNSLTDCPLEINLVNIQSHKRWEHLKFCNTVIVYSPNMVNNLQVTEIDTVSLDSVPNANMMACALEFFRVTVLECDDTMLLQFIMKYSENFMGYKSIRELLLRVDEHGNTELFALLPKLQSVEKLSLIIISYDEESLVNSVNSIVTAVHTMKLKVLNLHNVQRNIQFVQHLVCGLFDASQRQPKNYSAVNSLDNVDSEVECTSVLKELTIGYDKSFGKFGRANFGSEKDGTIVYLSLLQGLKIPLTNGQLERLRIGFDKNIQKKKWLETLSTVFPWNEQFTIDFEYTELGQMYTVYFLKFLK